MWQTLFVTILIFSLQEQLCSSKQQGCPSPLFIYPCQCSISRFNKSYLECENLNSDENFQHVLERSGNYIFEKVSIKDSNLGYLPDELFEDVAMRILTLDHVNLTKVLDETVFSFLRSNFEHPKILNIDSVRVESGSIEKLLKRLTKLETLDIKGMPLKTVGKDFTKYISKSLQSLSFKDTDTETIEKGAFDRFTKLDSLSFYNGSIQRLDRKMFPTPFSVTFLNFDYQKLTDIPDGLFADMPNMRILSLEGNQLQAISEKAFDRADPVSALYLNDNPIQCDCRVKWLVVGTLTVEVECAGPGDKQGKKIRNLSRGEFSHC